MPIYKPLNADHIKIFKKIADDLRSLYLSTMPKDVNFAIFTVYLDSLKNKVGVIRTYKIVWTTLNGSLGLNVDMEFVDFNNNLTRVLTTIPVLSSVPLPAISGSVPPTLPASPPAPAPAPTTDEDVEEIEEVESEEDSYKAYDRAMDIF